MVRSHPSRMTNAPCVSGLRRSLRQTRWRRRPSQIATLHWFDLKHMADMAIAGATVSARLVDELFIQQKGENTGPKISNMLQGPALRFVYVSEECACEAVRHRTVLNTTHHMLHAQTSSHKHTSTQTHIKTNN